MSKNKYVFLFFFLISLFLFSCSGGGGGSTSAPSSGITTPAINTITINASPIAKEDVYYSVDLSTITPPVTGVTITSGPSWLTYNSVTKKIEGIPTGVGSSLLKLSITTADGKVSFSNTTTIQTSGDPLKKYQWHLKNTGQSAFSSSGGTSGVDINVDAAHSSGVIGNSSIILVVSDGRIDLSHEDLALNADLTISKNYTLASPYSGNPTSSTDNGHGTTVASIMAAVGWNNIGIRGVCPSCKVVGYNFIESDQSVLKQINQAASTTVSGYNYSYGSGTCQVNPIDSSYSSQIRSTALNGRNGKGINFVTSAGNDFSGNNGGTCNFTYLGNSNLDQAKSYPYFIAVGAIDAQGLAATYSTPGANTWVVAPGGEGGQTKPGLVAADLEGCSSGNSKSSSTENAFESNSNGLNTDCKYTSTATGTSFASPTVAGLVGLLLAANPGLTWRDIKHILATTSKQVQPSAGNTTHPLGSGYDLSGHVYQQGWVTNAAGYKFHNWYGFGLVDAVAAVSLAKTYSNSLGAQIITEEPKTLSSLYIHNNLNLAIPDNSAVGVSDQINLRHNLKVEAVQITVSVAHTAATDIGVELTSPQGTKSILMNINSGITNTSLSNVTLLSNAFYGEKSLGNWTIKVIDGAAADTGTLTSWSIKVWGAKVSGMPDIIPPIAPSNLLGPNYFISDTVSPRFTWTASPSADIARYEYCIGTSALDCSFYPWTGYSQDTSGQAVGMFTAIGSTYYFNLRAIDTSENISSVISRSWINDDGGTWTLTSMTNAPTAKGSAAGAWTGSSALIIGGFNGSFVYETHKFNPVTNSWSSGAAPPTYFSDYASVWSGTEMLLWSSDNWSSSFLKVYNPSSNSWSAATNSGSPNNFTDASMVWTGSNAIVWGGGYYSNTGSKYNRSGNSWTATTTSSAPTARNSHAAVWTGAEMLIWGGMIGSSIFTNTGGRYNPTGNTWTAMTSINTLSARRWPASVWTGSGMLVWGGFDGESDGAIYNTTSNTWTKISSFGAPSGCGIDGRNIQAVFSGTKMFIVGCAGGYGGMYDLANDTWQVIKPPVNVRPRFGHTLLWLGDRILIWGGSGQSTGSSYQDQNTGATYVP